jgi:Family of unknown function (DUF6194)
MESIGIEEVAGYVTSTYRDVVAGVNWGERALFYNPGQVLAKGIYLLTFKERDGAHDSASRINRGGVYRLNLGITKATFVQLFGAIPARPAAGGVVATGHDFAALDTLTPHPVYGWMAWVAVLNPSPPTFERLKPLIAEGYDAAVEKFRKRARRSRAEPTA